MLWILQYTSNHFLWGSANAAAIAITTTDLVSKSIAIETVVGRLLFKCYFCFHMIFCILITWNCEGWGHKGQDWRNGQGLWYDPSKYGYNAWSMCLWSICSTTVLLQFGIIWPWTMVVCGFLAKGCNMWCFGICWCLAVDGAHGSRSEFQSNNSEFALLKPDIQLAEHAPCVLSFRFQALVCFWKIKWTLVKVAKSLRVCIVRHFNQSLKGYWLLSVERF